MRQHIEPNHVLGFGGIVDTGLFCGYAADLLHKQDPSFALGDVKGQIIGYHNEDMILMSSTLNGCARHFSSDQLDRLVEQTKFAPKLVAKLQGPYGFRNAKTKIRLDTGGSVMAGRALGACIQAFTDSSKLLVAPFNIPLLTGDHARHYGMICGTPLSVPIAFGKGGIRL